MSGIVRTYKELSRLPTFLERYRYLKLDGTVGEETFGFERYLNQKFYRSQEWKTVRNHVIARDLGRDLGMEGYDICGRVYVHHMNPIDPEDIQDSADILMNPEYLICVSFSTHNAIHYGSEDLLATEPAERKPNDTCPWRKV